MSKIKILPRHIANKIAAGEVVERPASVVKELLENAVDAGASEIKVRVVDGGKKKIVVTDNGKGMDKKDLKLCLKRHSTSKIKNEYDLLKIKSLGFRGEALSSIASVSKTTIRSKTKKSDTGYELYSEGGKQDNPKPYGMPEGTQVVVEDLFYNMPARKKFLRSAGTEIKHITDIFINNALSYPNIGFSLFHNKRNIYKLQKNYELKARITEILGEVISEKLLSIKFDHPHLKISGFIGKPQIARERKKYQFIFVNNRPVSDKIAAAAVREAYGSLLPHGTYPVFILYLEMPYNMVDVNVHPRKEEVRFVNGSLVFNSIKNSVEHALAKKDLTFDYKKELVNNKKYNQTYNKSYVSSNNWVVYDRPRKQKNQFINTSFWETTQTNFPHKEESEIIQVHNLYLITQTENGILILDQHAAHERILYEKFLRQYKKEKNKKNIQNLLIPATIRLGGNDTKILSENLPVFRNLGIQISEFGKNTFKINAVPQVLQEYDISKLLNEVIDDLSENKKPKDVDTKRKKAISYLACRSAVKAGDYLTQQKRRMIIDELEETKTKYTCPHGRPTKVEVTLYELERIFKRK